jgi:hypothetical protein
MLSRFPTGGRKNFSFPGPKGACPGGLAVQNFKKISSSKFPSLRKFKKLLAGRKFAKYSFF